jgi:hypothetical protein
MAASRLDYNLVISVKNNFLPVVLYQYTLGISIGFALSLANPETLSAVSKMQY